MAGKVDAIHTNIEEKKTACLANKKIGISKGKGKLLCIEFPVFTARSVWNVSIFDAFHFQHRIFASNSGIFNLFAHECINIIDRHHHFCLYLYICFMYCLFGCNIMIEWANFSFIIRSVFFFYGNILRRVLLIPIALHAEHVQSREIRNTDVERTFLNFANSGKA